MRVPTTAPTPTYSPDSDALSRPAHRRVSVDRVVWWTAVLALAGSFAWRYALRYFHYDAASYGSFFWPRARWVLPHVIAGMAALFLGPLQFWSAFRERYRRLHRWSGRAYLTGVALGATMAIGLVIRMPPGPAHAAGLAGLAVAWVLTSGMALLAIRRGNIPQHREWMIRSYVVTFAFVTYRALLEVIQARYPGSDADLRAFLSWSCWAVPLLLTEVVLQGRKMLRTPRRALPSLLD